MTKYVILNSDDFGLSDGINRGILEAHHHGLVTSTCTMVNMPAAAEGLRLAPSAAPALGVGLHFTLSFGAPVADPARVSSLVNGTGQFAQNYQQLMDMLPCYTDAHLEIELQAQFDHFVQLAGRLPTHIDSHHAAAYMHPAAFDVLCRLCAEHDLSMRRSSLLDDGGRGDDLPTNSDGTLVDQLQAIYDKYGQPRTTDYLVNTFRWERGSRVELFRSAFAGVRDGYTEILCHVGYAESLQEDYTFQREDELAAVMDADVMAVVQSCDIQMITFADLP